MLSASSLAASFLGQQAFRHPQPPELGVAALLAFVVSIATSVFVLMPRRNLIFSEAGSRIYEDLYASRGDMADVYRRLAYQLDRFWKSNDEAIVELTRVYRISAAALVVEILALVGLLGDTVL